MILLDSDVLIAHLRGAEAAREWLQTARRNRGPLSISVVTITEVAGGMRSGERSEVRRLLATLGVAPISQRVVWRAAEMMRRYRRSHSGIGLGDYLVAATAETQGLELATLNVAHYPMFEGLVPAFEV